MNVDYLQPKAAYPLQQAGQRALIWQVRAQRGRVRSDADLAVVELATQRRTGHAGESDLVRSRSHTDLTPLLLTRVLSSVPFRGAFVITRQGVTDPPAQKAASSRLLEWKPTMP